MSARYYPMVMRVASFSKQTCPRRKVTLIPGQGIGPEICTALLTVFDAAQVPIDWDEVDITLEKNEKGKMQLPENAIKSLIETRIGVKGPLQTPQHESVHKLVNASLRKELKLFANVRPCRPIGNLQTPYGYVDLVTIRENTEGEYTGIEHEVVPGVVQSVRVITEEASLRVAKFAFDYAKNNNRKKLTIVHKANIMHLSDGLFLDCFRRMSKQYPEIFFEDRYLDTICNNVIRCSKRLDVLAMPNMYGDIMSDMCSGLVGGLGMTPSMNIGEDAAIFEAVHGTAPDLVGKDMANPTAIILSGVLMLRHIGMCDHADKIEDAVIGVINEGQKLTADIGGNAKCSEYTDAICDKLLEALACK